MPPGIANAAISERWLLLLSGPPSDLTIVNIRAAYGPAFEDVLIKLARALAAKQLSNISIDVGIIQVGIEDPAYPKSTTFPGYQKLTSLLYRLICMQCAKLGYDADFESAADFCIFFIRDDQSESQAQNTNGPEINLVILGRCSRPWTRLLTVESEEGEHLSKRFLSARHSFSQRAATLAHERLRGGTSIVRPPKDGGIGSKAVAQGKSYRSVAVGGTFDHLHPGHKLLLTATAHLLVSATPQGEEGSLDERRLIVGITGDELLKNKKYAEHLENWEDREASVFRFLNSILSFAGLDSGDNSVQHRSSQGADGRSVDHILQSGLTIHCEEISDAYGPTITDESIQALVLSGETRTGGKAVNDKRVEKGWEPLDIFEVDVLDPSEESEELGSSEDAADYSGKISSTSIRKRLQERK
ncbi:hypothetical protein MMC25_002543 [Agyrium rufum]|nr:hypothetical protein [Agyrium rufum]